MHLSKARNKKRGKAGESKDTQKNRRIYTLANSALK